LGHIPFCSVAVMDDMLGDRLGVGGPTVFARFFTVGRQTIPLMGQFVSQFGSLVPGHVPMGRILGGHYLPVDLAIVSPIGGHVAYGVPWAQHPIAALDGRDQKRILADIGRFRVHIGYKVKGILSVTGLGQVGMVARYPLPALAAIGGLGVVGGL